MIRRARDIEAEQGEIATAQAIDDDPGHQEAGDHEEHIDADEAAIEAWNTEMEKHHGDHGDCAQGVDVVTKKHREYPCSLFLSALQWTVMGEASPHHSRLGSCLQDSFCTSVHRKKDIDWQPLIKTNKAHPP